MSIDLRDHFAIQFAAALMRRQHSVQHIVSRAYDLADAMLAERSRRIDAEAAEAMSYAPPASVQQDSWQGYAHQGLLDDPAPPEDADSAYEAYLDQPDPGDAEVDPHWLELEMDPSWEVEPRWASESSLDATDPADPGVMPIDPEAPGAAVVRPGLARTQPQEAAGEGDQKGSAAEKDTDGGTKEAARERSA
jgi:hypothetical protein